MPSFPVSRFAAAVLGLLVVPAAFAQFTTPNTIPPASPTGAVTVGDLTFENLGLQGVGRISASALDAFGETFGSVSGLQIGNWGLGQNGAAYQGTFYTVPDRGFNSDTIFSNYAARIQTVNFTFTPYTGSAPLGGTTINEKLASQSQIVPTYLTGQLFTYANSNGLPAVSTGLDPAAGSKATLLGQSVPYVFTSSGFQVNKLALDAEALVLKGDGSGYIGDEYGANIYYFNSAKEIVSVLPQPAATQPHRPAGTLNFESTVAPINGRRNNQGMEGVALSPDGTKLYGLMQSATVQDTNGGQQQTRNNTRLLVYDVGAPGANGVPTHTLSAEYALQLPTFTLNGSGGALNRTAAQSEVVALGDGKLLVLSRDGNGLGSPQGNPAMYKSVLLVDIKGATNLLNNAAVNAEGGQISPGGVLLAGITPVSFAQALNMLNTAELTKFNFNTNNSVVDKLTLSEKWEGMALVSALDPAHPNDYFLFIANDNDFRTTSGLMRGADGELFAYNASDNVGAGLYADNDTVFLAYRVTINPVPEPGTYALLLAGLATIGWVVRRRARR
jgi:hypothetical protein